MSAANETVADILAEWRDCLDSADPIIWDDPIRSLMRTEINHQKDYAKRLEIAHMHDALIIERIVRDAIISYTEQYVTAPNDDVEREIQHRAEVANEWLSQHGFAEEPTNWSKEEIPCL